MVTVYVLFFITLVFSDYHLQSGPFSTCQPCNPLVSLDGTQCVSPEIIGSYVPDGVEAINENTYVEILSIYSFMVSAHFESNGFTDSISLIPKQYLNKIVHIIDLLYWLIKLSLGVLFDEVTLSSRWHIKQFHFTCSSCEFFNIEFHLYILWALWYSCRLDLIFVIRWWLWLNFPFCPHKREFSINSRLTWMFSCLILELKHTLWYTYHHPGYAPQDTSRRDLIARYGYFPDCFF